MLGPLPGTTERIHQCCGGIKTLGTFIGTDTFVKAASMALICSPDNTPAHSQTLEDATVPNVEPTRVEDDFSTRAPQWQPSHTIRLPPRTTAQTCCCNAASFPKLVTRSEPLNLVADSAAAAHKLIVQAFFDMNDISAEEAAAAFNRLALPPSLAGCSLRYYPDCSSRAPRFTNASAARRFRATG